MTAFEDHVHGTLKISPSSLHLGHDTIIPGVEEPQAKTAKKSKIARPPNAFILYRQSLHPLLKAENPELHNNQICKSIKLFRVTSHNSLAAVELGLKWKNEDQRVKEFYIHKAKQIKAQHLAQHPNYQYKPRKPSEKKRRVSRRKNSASANAVHSESASSGTRVAHSVEVPSPENLAHTIPEVHKNSAGNAMLELGDPNIDANTFEKILDHINQSSTTQPSRIHTVLTEANTTPVIYDEKCQESQNEGNFFWGAQEDWNPFEPLGLQELHDIFDEPSEFIGVIAQADDNLHESTAAFDMAHAENTDAILARMSSAFDED